MWSAIAIILVLLVLIGWTTTRKSRFGHWARVAVMCLSGGFIFPHATTEDMDVGRNGTDKDAKAKKP